MVFGHININLLRTKFDFLWEQIKGSIDVFIIPEPKLDDSFPHGQFVIDGFHVPLIAIRMEGKYCYTLGKISQLKFYTAWKVSEYGVISCPYFPVFSANTGKYGPEITPYLYSFYVVLSHDFPRAENTFVETILHK